MRWIAPGSRVLLDGGTIRGRVLHTCLGINGVDSYEVVWYVEGERLTDWVDPCEVEDADEAEDAEP